MKLRIEVVTRRSDSPPFSRDDPRGVCILGCPLSKPLGVWARGRCAVRVGDGLATPLAWPSPSSYRPHPMVQLAILWGWLKAQGGPAGGGI